MAESEGAGIGASDGVAETGMTLELLERLMPYLGESMMVLRHDWSIKANLAPPGGLIGRGLGLGGHALEDMHPDDAVRVLELGLAAFDTEPGGSGAVVVRMMRGDGTYGPYEITATNRSDDPVIGGMVVRTRPVLALDDDLERLNVEQPLMETLAQVLPVAVLILDRQGHTVFANEAACELLDRPPEAIKHASLAVLFAQCVVGQVHFE